jgi:hypothetical protein
MKALIIGLVVMVAAVATCLPQALGWWDEVLVFLKGGLPVLAAFVGLIAVFVGIADIKDKAEAKKGEAAPEAEKKE